MTEIRIVDSKVNMLNNSTGIIELNVQFQFNDIPVSPRVAVIYTDKSTGENRRIPMAITVEDTIVNAKGVYEIPYVFLDHSPETTVVSFSVSDGTDNGEILETDIELPHYKRKGFKHFLLSSKREKIKTLVDIVLNTVCLPFKLLPVKKNRVSFFSNRTDDLTGNIREVYNAISQDKTLDIKVLSKGGGVSSSLSMLFGFMYLYMTSKVVFVDDYFHLISYIRKKKIQSLFSCGTPAVLSKHSAFQEFIKTQNLKFHPLTTDSMITQL